MLSAKGVNPYLVSWTGSCLIGRSCRLLFLGSPQVFSPESVGTPQGSPVSPLLFVIYVSRLHIEVLFGLTLFYVDNLALTAWLGFYLHNIQLLQYHYALVKASGSRMRICFSIAKTELIYWCTNQDRDHPCHAPIHLDTSIFRPKDDLTWFGYWFTPSLSTTPHFT